MTTTKVPVTFNCKACGEKLSWSDDATDNTRISCKKCGKYFGTYADLRHTATEAVRDKAVSIFKDALRGRR
jgi:transcription elongation factor Elf1